MRLEFNDYPSEVDFFVPDGLSDGPNVKTGHLLYSVHVVIFKKIICMIIHGSLIIFNVGRTH